MLTAAATRRQRYTRTGMPLPRADGRTRSSRRFRQLIEAFTAELGGGDLSEIKLAQLRQLATLTLRAELMSASIVKGDAVDGDELIRINSEIRRLLRGFGLNQASDDGGFNAFLADKYPDGNDGG